MIDFNTKGKYNLKYSNDFKKNYKKIKKQGKDINKLKYVIDMLSKQQELEAKYKDHKLVDNKYFKDCRECHVEFDWLLVYQYNDNDLILLLVNTGSHSEVLNM